MKLLFEWLFVAFLEVARGLPAQKKRKGNSEHFHFPSGQALGMLAGAFIFVYALARVVGEMAWICYVEISPKFTSRRKQFPGNISQLSLPPEWPAKGRTWDPRASPALQPHPLGDLFQ